MRKQDRQMVYYSIILTRIMENKSFLWGDVVEDVRANNNKEVVPKNWFDVRGVLQYFIDEGLIKRTENLHVEEYVLIGIEKLNVTDEKNKKENDFITLNELKSNNGEDYESMFTDEDGIAIYNPYTDNTGRFDVNPITCYGELYVNWYNSL